MDGPSSSGPKSVVSFVESGWVKLALFHGSINWSKGVGFHKESIMLNQYSILFNFKPPKTIDLSCIFKLSPHCSTNIFFSHKQSLPNQISNMILPLSIYITFYTDPTVHWQSFVLLSFWYLFDWRRNKRLDFLNYNPLGVRVPWNLFD